MLALAELSVVPLVVLFIVFLVFVNLVFIWRKSKRKETGSNNGQSETEPND